MSQSARVTYPDIWNWMSNKRCLFYSGTNPRIYGPLDLYCWRCGVSFRHPAQGGGSNQRGRFAWKLHTILVCNIWCLQKLYLSIYYIQFRLSNILYSHFELWLYDDFWLSFELCWSLFWLLSLLSCHTVINLSGSDELGLEVLWCPWTVFLSSKI